MILAWFSDCVALAWYVISSYLKGYVVLFLELCTVDFF